MARSRARAHGSVAMALSPSCGSGGPEHHFVFDHTKWIFYAATCYTWLGDDKPAAEHAQEIIAYHTRPDGSSNAPMRTANAHIDLGIIHARHGDLDQAVHHGLTAFGFDRKAEASLLSLAEDLDHLLDQCHLAWQAGCPGLSPGGARCGVKACPCGVAGARSCG
jgi:hypothetical protein